MHVHRSILLALSLAFCVFCAGCDRSEPRQRTAAPPATPAADIADAASTAVKANVTRAPFGAAPDGAAVELFTLTNAGGMQVQATNFGGTITSIKVRDRTGALGDVALGFTTMEGYHANSPYLGVNVGRYANRIANARFSLEGRTYKLAANNGTNSIHGGVKGFDKYVWQAEPFEGPGEAGVALTHTSADGDEGYPGTLRARVTYTLTNRDELAIDTDATTDQPTIVNLTNHTYWNLAGDGARDILGHVMTIESNEIVPVDSTLIPTGQLMPVAGTPFDFRTPTAIGARIDHPHVQIRHGGGYDHTFVVSRGTGASLSHAIRVTEPTTGRTLDIFTTEPGVQVYSGNFLDGSFAGKRGRIYRRRFGLALETHHYPDSPNQPSFPSVVLRPAETYRTRTVWRFGTE
jgi:aldose 1-epimerase